MSEAAYYEQDALWGTEHIENPQHLAARFATTAAMVPPGIDSVIDVGAGDGRLSHHLQTVGAAPMAPVVIERSIAALSHYAGPAAAGSVDAIPARDSAADLVLCCEVLEHLPQPVFDLARREVARVAKRWILISVPNRENLRRGAVRCPSCGCCYSPIRHLRSFDPSRLEGLFSGYHLRALEQTGPRLPVYPRALRALLERRGIVQRSGSPVCPQCGEPYRLPRSSGISSPRDAIKTTTPWVRRLVPASPRRYWLCALYERA